MKNKQPTKEQIEDYMNLHNNDEVGINNQWSFEDAEYHLLLSDEFYSPEPYIEKVKPKKKETRVYVINCDDLEVAWDELPNEEFMSIAEETGTVFTLQGFVDSFNENTMFSTETHVIRIL